MPLHLYNTLTRTLEPFQPAEGNTVRMYSCGPTVHNHVHIGNLRTFAFQDVLRRHLRHCGFELLHVMNITDVDDKIIAAAAAADQTLAEYTEQYTEAFKQDSETLRLEEPEHVTAATQHIDAMIDLIRRLEKNGLTYQSEGSIYFRIANFAEYGKLARLDTSGMQAGARVDQDEYEKDNARDFALWKASKDGEPHWDSPFGPGRPGWHIECSAMGMQYLGETFDIHTGGVDLVFPHHENEIAQSQGATGKPFVRFWAHAEHLLVDGQKMSKSLGNFHTLRDLIEKGHSPEAIRYLLISAPYRKQLNFTMDGLRAAATAIERLRNFKHRLETETFPEGENEVLSAAAAEADRQFVAGMDDDLNTAQALGAVFDYVRDANTKIDAGEFLEGNREAAAGLLDLFDSIFDVLDAETAGKMPPEEIERLIDERAQARMTKDFARADEIRDQLQEQGVVLEDSRDGTYWKYV